MTYEGSFGINKEAFAFTTTHVNWKLREMGESRRTSVSTETLAQQPSNPPVCPSYYSNLNTHLTSDCKRMTQLTLSRPIFSKELRNATSLHSTSQDIVHILAAGGDGDELRPSHVVLGSCSEAHWDQFAGCETGREATLVYA